MSENCPVCGLPTGAGSGGDALANHINDYNDPHRTLALVPRTYYGVGAPLVTEGFKEGDWYVDTSARVIYSCAVENTPSGQVLSWVPASTATAVTAADLASALSGYVLSTTLASTLAGYVTSASAANFVTQTDLSGRGYATQTWVNSALSGYATESWVTGLGYINASALASELASYVTGTALTTALGGYYGKTASDARYALKSEIASFLETADVAALLAQGFVHRAATSPGVYPELDLDTILNAYLTSSAAATTYLAKTDAASTYATKSELATGLAGRLRPSDLASAMAPYLLASTAASTYLSKTEAASTYLTAVTLAPFIEDFITADDLPEELADYASKSWVSATYATLAALNNYVTSTALSAALASYVSSTTLEGILASYKTAVQCDASYVTPAYLAANNYLVEGAGYFANFVTRSATGSRDIDTILGSWPVSSLTAGETKPPQTGAVKAAIDAEATARSALAETVAGLVVTGGANALKDISETVSVTISGVSTALLKLYDSATNYIATTSNLVVDNKLRISLPASPGTGVARDFLFCVAFSHATSVGQVPHVVDIIRNRDGTVPQFVSYMNLPFDLTGITYGTTVVWGFTELTSGKFAVTRKVLYSVGGGAGA